MMVAAGALAAAALAQMEGGDRGVPPVDSSGSYEVDGFAVDVSAKTAEAARYDGWRIAQRKAWVQLSQRLGAGGAAVSDGTLDSLVSGIVVQNEQIGRRATSPGWACCSIAPGRDPCWASRPIRCARRRCW